MQDESIAAFKMDLRSYAFKKKEIKRIEDKIQECYDRLGGVRGVDPSREPIHATPNKDVEYAIRDQIEACEAKLRLLCDQTRYIEQTLEKMETTLKTAVIAVYVSRHSIRSVAGKMYISESGLRKRMNKEIKKARQ
jgi:DNA-directed RNA polymerase specialized sigma24 family protein